MLKFYDYDKNIITVLRGQVIRLIREKRAFIVR